MKFDISTVVNPIRATAKAATSYMVAHRPEGLIITGMVGLISAIGIMYVQSPKMHEDIAKQDWKGLAKDTLPVAIPTIIATGAGIKGLKENSDRYAAATALCSMLEESFNERKMAEYIGLSEKKVADISKAEAENAVANNPPDFQYIEQIEGGTCVHYDMRFKKWFKADVNKVDRILLDCVNAFDNLGEGEMVSISDYYYDLGSSEPLSDFTDDSIYKRIGWAMPVDRSFNEADKPDMEVHVVKIPGMEPVRVIRWVNLVFSDGYGNSVEIPD